MIYELSYDGYSLGMFPTADEAAHLTAYLPKGRYQVRQWTQDGDFLYYDPTANRTYEIVN